MELNAYAIYNGIKQSNDQPIGITKNFQDLYGKKTGDLMGNFKEGLNKCQDVPCHGLENLIQ